MTNRRRRGLPPVLVMCELCDWAVRSDSWRPAKKLLREHQADRHSGAHLKVLL